MTGKLNLGLRLDVDVKRAEKIRQLIAEIDALGGEGAEAAGELQQLSAALEISQSQQRAIDSYRKTGDALERTRVEYQQAAAAAREMGRSMASGSAPTRAMSQDFERARARVRELKQAQIEQAAAHQRAAVQMRQAGVTTRNATLSEQRLAASVQQTTRRLDAMEVGLRRTRAGLRATGQEGDRSGRQIDQGYTVAARGVRSISTQLDRMQKLLGAGFAVAKVKQWAGDVGQLADQYKRLSAQINLATDGDAEFAAAQEETFRIAQRARAELDGIVTLYARMKRALDEYGVSSEQVLGLTETIAKAMKVSGASATESAAALQQLSQGLQAGALRGDEFNSVMEQAPRLARAIADGLGVPISKLREMAEAGELTTERLKNALTSQREAVEREFAQLPRTIEDSWTNVESAWLRYVGQADAAAGASGELADALQLVADNMDALADVAFDAGFAALGAVVLGVTFKLRDFVIEARAAQIGIRALGTEAAVAAPKVGALGSALGIAGAAFSGWEIGTWLNSFAPVQRVAAMTIGALEKIGAAARFAADAIAAAFTDDTVDAALDRYNKRVSEIDQTVVAVFRRIDEEAGKAARGTQELSDAQQRAADGARNQAAAQAVAADKTREIGQEAQRAARHLLLLSEIEAAGIITAEQAAEQRQRALDQLAELGSQIPRTTEQNKQLADSYVAQAQGAKTAAELTEIQVRAVRDLKGESKLLGSVLVEVVKAREALTKAEREGVEGTERQADRTADSSTELFKLAELYRAGSISAEQFNTRVGELTDTTEQQTDKTKKSAGAMQQAAKSGSDLLGVMRAMQGWISAARAEMDELSDAALEAFNATVDLFNQDPSIARAGVVAYRAAADEMQKLANALQSTKDRARELQVEIQFASGAVGRWFKAVSIAANNVKREFLEQEIAAEKLARRLDKMGAASLAQLNMLDRQIDNYKLLDESTLSNLRSEVDRLRRAQDSLGESVESTIRALQDEIDLADNNQRAIEKRRYETQRGELLDQRKDAGADIRPEIDKALKLLDEAYRRRIERLDEQQREQDARDSRTDQAKTTTPTERVIQLRGPSGAVVSGTFEAGQAEALLDMLQEAGLRAS